MRRRGPLRGSELMLGSEGARHLIALIAVAAAVGAQSLVTPSVMADQDRQAVDFGVRLLAAEFEMPASLLDRNLLALPSSAEDSVGTSATLRGPDPEPMAPDPTAKRKRRWFGASVSELQRRRAQPAPSLDRRKPNRDSVGSPIELTENEVLIPVRVAY